MATSCTTRTATAAMEQMPRVASLDRINALADSSPGFVWRLQTEEGDATSIRPFENENLLINMSVWRDVASLNEYVYSSAHVELMRRRREWFERMQEAYLALWWIPAGHRPTVAEAIAKLGASNRVDAARIARTKGWL